jgi:hypothetical protein
MRSSAEGERDGKHTVREEEMRYRIAGASNK